MYSRPFTPADQAVLSSILNRQANANLQTEARTVRVSALMLKTADHDARVMRTFAEDVKGCMESHERHLLLASVGIAIGDPFI
jgi:hypothetical protein